MESMIIKQNGGQSSVTHKSANGIVNVFEAGDLTPAQRDGLREMVVNWFCRANGFTELYPREV